MGSLLRTSIAVAFLLLLPAVVYCDRSVTIDLFMDTNCTEVPTENLFSTSISYSDSSTLPSTFGVNVFNITQTFESAILTNVTGDVASLVACQFGFDCNATGAYQIPFNLDDLGACSTGGPPGTQFDRFLITS